MEKINKMNLKRSSNVGKYDKNHVESLDAEITIKLLIKHQSFPLFLEKKRMNRKQN